MKDNIEWESCKDSNGFRVLTSYDNFARAQMKSDLVTTLIGPQLTSP